MKKICIDFGSGVTKICLPGCGVVLTEATCIAVDEYTESGETVYSVKACGDKARALSGRSAINTRILNPVCEGDILHEGLCAELLKYFLEKIEITASKAKRTEVIFLLPCGTTRDIRQKYRRVAEECGFEYVGFTLTSYAAVLGHNVGISESTPVISLDIGYSMSNIAVFSQDGMISGMSVNIGGKNIDLGIMDVLAEKQDLKIGSLTAERLKNTVGSMLHDDNKMMVVDGTDIKNGAPSSVSVNSEQIYGVIEKYVDKILEYILTVISKLPAEVASAIMHSGVYLSGGVLKMDGLAEYLEKKLGIPVNMPEEPKLAAVIGGSAIISDVDYMDLFGIEEN